MYSLRDVPLQWPIWRNQDRRTSVLSQCKTVEFTWYVSLSSTFLLSRMQRMPRLLVVTADAIIHIYNINPVEGGECVLFKEHK